MPIASDVDCAGGSGNGPAYVHGPVTITALFSGPDALTGPNVHCDLPGPRSAGLLARQQTRESNARTYPRNLPVGIVKGSGSFVRDLDGNVFIDFLTGAAAAKQDEGAPLRPDWSQRGRGRDRVV